MGHPACQDEPTMSRRVSRSILETEPVNGSSPPPPAGGDADHTIAQTHASAATTLTPGRVPRHPFAPVR